MIELMKSRKMIRMMLSEQAKQLVADYSEKTDITEQGIVSRIVEWWNQQEQAVKDAVLGHSTSGLDIQKIRAQFQPLDPWWTRKVEARVETAPDGGAVTVVESQSKPGARKKTDQRSSSARG